MALLNILEDSETALNVLQRKLKIETKIYEQEKRRFSALKDNLLNCEKRAQAEFPGEVPSEASLL
jgi:hypothetical protein